jgi:hypothetical protein
MIPFLLTLTIVLITCSTLLLWYHVQVSKLRKGDGGGGETEPYLQFIDRGGPPKVGVCENHARWVTNEAVARYERP